MMGLFSYLKAEFLNHSFLQRPSVPDYGAVILRKGSFFANLNHFLSSDLYFISSSKEINSGWQAPSLLNSNEELYFLMFK